MKKNKKTLLGCQELKLNEAALIFPRSGKIRLLMPKLDERNDNSRVPTHVVLAAAVAMKLLDDKKFASKLVRDFTRAAEACGRKECRK